MPTLKVPFNDLSLQHYKIKQELDSAISNVIKDSSFIRGPEVEKFEEKFSEFLGAKHCISCANGTDAIYLALRALNVKAGDEVIVPAHSWISTSSAVTQAGGTVVFCDTNDQYTIDIEKIQEKITKNTVGIIPVHLFGHPAEMDEIMEISSRNNLWVVEDCAQAHLATYKNKQVGTFGQMGTFSFYPGKNLGAMGDAGAIISNNKTLAERAAMFARHGGLVKGDHVFEGVNSRMDGIQAAILLVKLGHLNEWTASRRKIAAYYMQNIEKRTGLNTPKVADHVNPAWHLFVVKSNRREALRSHLNNNNIQTIINYPVALPYLPAYAHFKHSAKDFPNAYKNQSEILSIPIYPELNNEQTTHVISCINSFDK